MTHLFFIAPSYGVHQDDLLKTTQYFQNLGFQVTLPPDLIGQDPFCANSDEKRFEFLKQAFHDSSVDVVWSLAGGYGLTRLMPQLLELLKPTKQKLYIGFSDGTALHALINQMWEWPSLHGPMARQLACKRVGPLTIAKTLHFIQNGMKDYVSPVLRPLNENARNMEVLQGMVVGGNLSLIQTSLGTAWQLQPQDKIIFLEDIDERGYRIDRMLTHLRQAKIFESAKAIIFGDFTGGTEENGETLVEMALKRFCQEIALPVFRLDKIGHDIENVPLPFQIPLTFFIENNF